jgi:AcrR family transcriptional regulator
MATELDAATRARILEAAADQFGRRGYKRARLSDVIEQAGGTPKIFASHFASKKQLFAESFGIAGQKVVDRAIQAMNQQPDLPRKLLARFDRLLLAEQRPDPSMWALARSEALYEGGEPAAKAQLAYRTISSLHEAELKRMRERGPGERGRGKQGSGKRGRTTRDPGDWPPVADELMAYCLLGAEEFLSMRSTWDNRYSREEVLKAYLLLVLAVHAQYDGDLDVRGRWEDCVEMIGAGG